MAVKDVKEYYFKLIAQKGKTLENLIKIEELY